MKAAPIKQCDEELKESFNQGIEEEQSTVNASQSKDSINLKE